MVCNNLSHPIYCSRPSLGNELRIVKSNNPPPVPPIPTATISINPTSLNFIVGSMGQVTLANQSTTVALTDLQITLPAGLSLDPSSTCVQGGNLAVNSTCTLVFSAANLLTNANVTIQGSNSNLLNLPVTASPIRRRVTVGISNNNDPISYFSLDGGESWVLSPSQPVSAVITVLRSVACDATGLVCVAAGETISPEAPISYRTIDGGQSWASQVTGIVPVGATTGGFNKIFCDNSATKCVAVGTAIIGGQPQGFANVSSNGGLTWTLSSAIPGPTTFYLNQGLSCDETATNCVAVGNDSGGLTLTFISTNSGVDWTASTAPSGSIAAIDCDSNTGFNCAAVGGDGANIYAAYSINNSWSNSAVPTLSGALGAVNCTPDLAHCVAVRSTGSFPAVVISTNSAQTWVQSNPVPDTTIKILSGVFCDNNGQYCSMVGEFVSPIVALSYYSLDGGQNWTLSNFPLNSNVQLFDISGGAD